MRRGVSHSYADADGATARIDSGTIPHVVAPTPTPPPLRFESGVAVEWSPSQPRHAHAHDHAESVGPTTKSRLDYRLRSLAADVASASLCSSLVAVPVTVIDRAIVQSVAGTVPLGTGLWNGFAAALRRPGEFLRHPTYRMVWSVYLVTYATANSFDSALEEPVPLRRTWSDTGSGEPGFALERTLNQDILEKEERDRDATLKWAKFLSVTAANMGAAVAKDRAFARLFGTSAPSRLPLTSWACWVARDLLTVGAAFSLPKPLAAKLAEGEQPLLSERWAAVAAQLLPVMMVQVVSTPLHLLANDLYNFKRGAPRVVDPATGVLKSGEKTLAERLALLRREGPKSFVARLGRIAPAFGFGGIGNTHTRRFLREKMGLAAAA